MTGFIIDIVDAVNDVFIFSANTGVVLALIFRNTITCKDLMLFIF